MSMIYRHTKSPTLQTKMKRLSSFSPDEHIDAESLKPEHPLSASDALLNAVKIRLWRLIQSKLRRRPRTQSLKPIGSADILLSQSLKGQEMLEHESPNALPSNEILDPEAKEPQKKPKPHKSLPPSNHKPPEPKISHKNLLYNDILFPDSPTNPLPFNNRQSTNNNNHSADEDLFSSEQSIGNLDAGIAQEGLWTLDDDDVEILDCWM